jgi:hypothetical protein
MIDDPLELPPPDDPIQRVHTLARDLAYGVTQGKWGALINIRIWVEWRLVSDNYHLEGYFKDKWEGKQPAPDLLRAFGYLELIERQEYQMLCLLTQKAFTLLEQPLSPPSVFISYRRSESSALGLLLEARLKLAASDVNVFIDKALEPGDKWHGRLEKEVRQRPYFVCLLGPTSLGSPYVRDEILWALDQAQLSEVLIIPICHGGYRFDAPLHADVRGDAEAIEALVATLSVNNAIVVNLESAEEYELAVIKLLNRLGYSNI